jgi:hypothetical protein
MRIRSSMPGSGIRQNLYFKDHEIESMCVEALKNSRFMPDEPGAVDIESFVEAHFETNLDFGTSIEKGVLGYTLFDKKGKIRLVGVAPELANDTSVIGSRRCRATVAHEAGHCLMHPILFMEDSTQQLHENLDFQQSRILCRKGDFTGKYDGRWWEVQANKAIGEFLLPRHLVKMAVKDFLTPKGTLGLEVLDGDRREEAVQHVADTFDVNLTPARIRLAAMFPDAGEDLL